MNPELGREVRRAITKARVTTPELARRTGLGESWIKQVRSGRIRKPKPEWLSKLAREVGVEPAEWLALSSQLGAATEAARPDEATLISVLTRHTLALERLTYVLAVREGITLPGLDEPELDRLAGAAGQAAATEVTEPDQDLSPEETRRRVLLRSVPEPSRT